MFIVGVTTTGIYCRPSCPARTPHRRNVRFFPTAAAAQNTKLRACKRCRPDSSPGSPDWNTRQDVVARAMRLIADGEVDRSGVPGLAASLGYSPRHLTRLMTAELGAGPLAIARSQRVRTARTLIESTSMPFTTVAFAAGFDSIRQFNDDVRATFALTPTGLRERFGRGVEMGGIDRGELRLRLPYRSPFDHRAMTSFLRARSIDGIEHMTAERQYSRSIVLPGGPAVVSVRFSDGALETSWWLSDLADIAPGVARLRRAFDLDGDPEEVDRVLSKRRPMRSMVANHRGLRVPGTVDGFELAVRAIVGQQVSVAGARRVLGRIVSDHGPLLPTELRSADGAEVMRLFPPPAVLADLDPAELPLPRRRGATIVALSQSVVDGVVQFSVAEDLAGLRASLLARPGIGPWTADYVMMRAGHPDILLGSDLVVRRSLDCHGVTPEDAARWGPWRSTATMHLWLATSSGQNRS